MKPTPSKHAARKHTNNLNVGMWQEEKHNNRQNALNAVKQAEDLPHLKEKPIKFLLSR